MSRTKDYYHDEMTDLDTSERNAYFEMMSQMPEPEAKDLLNAIETWSKDAQVGCCESEAEDRF